MKKWMMILLACLLIVPVLAETVQDQALAFIQDAGIGADSVMRVGNDVIVTLMNGGTATLHMEGDFDKYNLGWVFDEAADEDVALYLDHALTLLNILEKKIPADMSSLTDAEKRRAENYAVMVSSNLLYLESVGQQGLRILLDKLSLRDDSGLNSLRARLCSRLLGALDGSPVDPKEGLAWYDALRLSVQDDLPQPDASVYVDDAFLAEVTQLMIAHEEARRADDAWGSDVDPEKTTTVVTLHNATSRQDGNSATVFAYVASRKYALYDGKKLRGLSGSGIPSRIELTRMDGAWTIVSVTESGDGTDYWPSILAFCDGDEILAESLLFWNDGEWHDEAVRAYLNAAGYPEVIME